MPPNTSDNEPRSTVYSIRIFFEPFFVTCINVYMFMYFFIIAKTTVIQLFKFYIKKQCSCTGCGIVLPSDVYLNICVFGNTQFIQSKYYTSYSHFDHSYPNRSNANYCLEGIGFLIITNLFAKCCCLHGATQRSGQNIHVHDGP